VGSRCYEIIKDALRARAELAIGNADSLNEKVERSTLAVITTANAVLMFDRKGVIGSWRNVAKSHEPLACVLAATSARSEADQPG
jgi:hypothetical protein